jgi:hypothetical protein
VAVIILIQVQYCFTRNVAKGMRKVFDCAGSNPGIVVTARRMNLMEIHVSCTGRTRTRTWLEFHLYSVERRSGSGSAWARTGLRVHEWARPGQHEDILGAPQNPLRAVIRPKHPIVSLGLLGAPLHGPGSVRERGTGIGHGSHRC